MPNTQTYKQEKKAQPWKVTDAIICPQKEVRKPKIKKKYTAIGLVLL